MSAIDFWKYQTMDIIFPYIMNFRTNCHTLFGASKLTLKYDAKISDDGISVLRKISNLRIILTHDGVYSENIYVSHAAYMTDICNRVLDNRNVQNVIVKILPLENAYGICTYSVAIVQGNRQAYLESVHRFIIE